MPWLEDGHGPLQRKNQVTFVGQGFPSSISASNGFTYDPSGSGNVWFDGQNNYLYDGESRVCAVQSTITGAMAAYIYDASGTRVAKGSITSPSCNLATNGFKLTNQYLLGLGGEQVTELSGTGAWVHSNVWAGSHLDATYDPRGLHFHLADPLGSRRVQLNAQGAVEETCQSLPFGDALQCVLTSIASADDATEHHFTGKERDAESGLDYFGARYYGSSMGRFMSPDWSANPEAVPYSNLDKPQSLNLYSYAGNSPLSVTDPDDHCPNGLGWLCSAGQWLGQAISNTWQRVENGVTGYGWHTNQQVQKIVDNTRKVMRNAGASPDTIEGLTYKQTYRLGVASKHPGLNQVDVGGAIVSFVVGGAASTGRTDPANLNEQLAMEQAKANPTAGTEVPLKGGMNDPRWPGSDGWVKMRQNVNGTEVHYVRNVNTGEVADFKFK